jgi:uncharacterized membrane protein
VTAAAFTVFAMLANEEKPDCIIVVLHGSAMLTLKDRTGLAGVCGGVATTFK